MKLEASIVKKKNHYLLALVGVPRTGVKHLTSSRFLFHGRLNRILQGYLLPPTAHPRYYRKTQPREHWNSWNSRGSSFVPLGCGSAGCAQEFSSPFIVHVRNEKMLEIQIFFLNFLISCGCFGWFLVVCVRMRGQQRKSGLDGRERTNCTVG